MRRWCPRQHSTAQHSTASTYVGQDELDQVQRQLLCVRGIGVRARRRREPGVYGRSDGPLGAVEAVRGGGGSFRSRMRSACGGRCRRVAGHGRLRNHDEVSRKVEEGSRRAWSALAARASLHLPASDYGASSRFLNDPFPHFALARSRGCQPPMGTTASLSPPRWSARASLATGCPPSLPREFGH